MLVGITGIIGSGKTFIGNMLKKMGYVVYDSDDFVMQTYLKNNIKVLLNKEFGCVIEDRVDKQIIKNEIIKNHQKLQQLNEIIHPDVISSILEIKRNNLNQLVFVEIPLLFECNLQIYCDYTIAILIDEEMQQKQLKNRDEKNFEFMKILLNEQFSQEKKASMANATIQNQKDLQKVYHSLESLVAKLQEIR